MHLGSLYHDDVMDEATTRHFVESVNARWGNLQAILAGDYLLAKASEIAAALGTEVAGLLAATIARLCEGQVAELQDAFNAGPHRGALPPLDRRQDRGAVRHVVPHRRRSSAACPATRSRPSPPSAQSYGMAFQIVDDVLDVVATDEELGKPSGHDMVEGTYTLPVLRVLAGGDGADELKDLLGSPLDDDASACAARDIVRADADGGRALGRRRPPPRRPRHRRPRRPRHHRGRRLAGRHHRRPAGQGRLPPLSLGRYAPARCARSASLRPDGRKS